MDLDIRSILVVAAVTEILFAVMLTSAWTTRRLDSALLYWSLGSLCMGLACATSLLRGQIPDLISIEGSNILTYSGLGFRLAGLRSFAGQPVRLGWLLLPAFLLGLLFHFREPLGLDVTRRVIIAGMLGLGFGLLMLVELRRAQREERLTMRGIVIALIALQTLNDAVRLIVGASGAFRSNNYLAPESLFSLLLLNVLCVYGVLNLACFMMMFERRQNELVRMATRDTLTGLLNRAGFNQLAWRQARRCEGDRQPVSVLAMDLDHFKLLNDRHGHEGGDVVLRAFADCARLAMRPADLLSRPGGEEFWALMSNADPAEAQCAAQRICDQFQALRISVDNQKIAATVSIGVTQVAPGEPVEAAPARADRALYEAKRTGRGRVVMHPAAHDITP